VKDLLSGEGVLINGQEEAFLRDVLAWFRKTNDGHMGKWQYFDPKFDDDPARGGLLWQEWVEAESHFYMLKSQSALISRCVKEIRELIGPVSTLLDLGPGEESAVVSNTFPFMKAFANGLRVYIPVDLCESFATRAASLVSKEGLNIEAYPRVADFTKTRLGLSPDEKTLALCFGGIIGNYEGFQNTGRATELLSTELQSLRQHIPLGSHIIFGLDANQDPASLYQSYDHPVHAAYEINVLYRIRRDLMPNETGFKPDKWKYSMAWYPEGHQFCHIAECTQSQNFLLSGQRFTFQVGEQLVVDNSFKFPVEVFQHSARLAGFETVKSFLDDQDRMALHLLKAV
jgi:L-histidine Nalpha-methyltransferase